MFSVLLLFFVFYSSHLEYFIFIFISALNSFHLLEVIFQRRFYYHLSILSRLHYKQAAELESGF
jgi:hypothetical protein